MVSPLDIEPVPTPTPAPSVEPTPVPTPRPSSEPIPKNIVGLLESDPELRGAINEVIPRKRGGIRNLIAQLGHAVAVQDYGKAAEILEQLQFQYGNAIEDAVEDALEEHIPASEFNQIPKPSPQ